jgi:hypothetical protein
MIVIILPHPLYKMAISDFGHLASGGSGERYEIF